jgi:hypothetical protein
MPMGKKTKSKRGRSAPIRERRARQKAVSSVTPPPGLSTRAPKPGGPLEKDTMDPIIIQNFWNQTRMLLVNFRATTNSGTDKPTALAGLEQRINSAATTLDPDRRTNPYNLPSLYQDQMDAISSKAMYLANKWINDGMPPVPNV